MQESDGFTIGMVHVLDLLQCISDTTVCDSRVCPRRFR